LAWAALGLAGAALLGASVSSCVGQNSDEIFACPSQPKFIGEATAKVMGCPDVTTPITGVSEFMSRRCGTLDCHGSDDRPMRIYGRFGLRHPAENNVAGGKATTTAELKANYGAVCSVEPEAMQKTAMDQGNSAEKLLLVRKARGVESHKGGTVVNQGSPGDDCILGWLKGDCQATVSAACQKAIDGL
jgi:hypothetical protein